MQDTTSLLRFLVHITTTLPEQDTSQKGTLTPTTAIHNVYFKNESEIDSMPAVISTMDEWNAYGEQFTVELGSKNSLLNTEPSLQSIYRRIFPKSCVAGQYLTGSFCRNTGVLFH